MSKHNMLAPETVSAQYSEQLQRAGQSCQSAVFSQCPNIPYACTRESVRSISNTVTENRASPVYQHYSDNVQTYCSCIRKSVRSISNVVTDSRASLVNQQCSDNVSRASLVNQQCSDNVSRASLVNQQCSDNVQTQHPCTTESVGSISDTVTENGTNKNGAGKKRSEYTEGLKEENRAQYRGGSFLPRITRDCNSLSIDAVEATTVDTFVSRASLPLTSQLLRFCFLFLLFLFFESQRENDNATTQFLGLVTRAEM